jgi:hypothetical protein
MKSASSKAFASLKRGLEEAVRHEKVKRVAMRAKYDFDYSKTQRGKYLKRLLKEGSNVVVLDRDVAKAFPDSAAVNKALRSVMKSRKPRRASRP